MWAVVIATYMCLTKVVTCIGSYGSGDGQFNGPCSISIIGEVMYIADFHIQKLTTGGKFLHKFGKEGSGQELFGNPCDVVVDSKNRVIVSDGGNNRVQVFTQDGDQAIDHSWYW